MNHGMPGTRFTADVKAKENASALNRPAMANSVCENRSVAMAAE
jgi:hypothetical protein